MSKHLADYLLYAERYTIIRVYANFREAFKAMDDKEYSVTLEELDDFNETFGTYTFDEDFSDFLQVFSHLSSSDPLFLFVPYSVTLEELDDFNETFGTYTFDEDFSDFLQVFSHLSSSDPLFFVCTLPSDNSVFVRRIRRNTKEKLENSDGNTEKTPKELLDNYKRSV
ncbi:hypothetical protein MA16_Dca001875 [Dendrobium catenatum]|uniref:Uncharacterized protein n=1 Tax=Dendrobium catenatum TaxID=906689 RepID=A0A2I0XDS1_9ASPA|nr:hypothetical protein MA16_Dca001875 [Dendrobium catenatum]